MVVGSWHPSDYTPKQKLTKSASHVLYLTRDKVKRRILRGPRTPATDVAWARAGACMSKSGRTFFRLNFLVVFHFLVSYAQWEEGARHWWPHAILIVWTFWTRKGHRQSDEHWNCFKGIVGETSQRRGGAHMGFFERIDTILNWT